MAKSLKLYMDTHISKQVAVQLRARGVDAIRCEEVGLANASDPQHLEYALKEERALVSMDRHFLRWYKLLKAQGKPHKGIFFVSRYLQGAAGIGRIVSELHEYYQLIEIGAGILDDDIYDKMIFIRKR